MKILITGASTGIGAETARVLAEGNQIFVHYNSSSDAAMQVVNDVAAGGGAGHALKADLRSEAGCRELFGQLEEATDSLDVLVNNAGGLIRRAPAIEYDWALMQETPRSSPRSNTLREGVANPGVAPGAMRVWKRRLPKR